MEAGTVFNYRLEGTGRAIYYDGTKECALEIEKSIPKANVVYDCNSHTIQITRNTKRGDLGPNDTRFASADSYIVLMHGGGRICTVMDKEHFEKNLVSVL